ncbi:2-dehydro-3-deoxygalactonokinase [Urechidicola sp. KH5]
MNVSQFISVDWGTTNLRVRLVSTTELNVLSEVVSDMGIKTVFSKWQETQADRVNYFLNVLKQKISQLKIVDNNVPIVISGMASSSIGVKELPYAKLPFDLKGKSLLVEKVENLVLENNVFLISGVCSDSDVIRGEEVQVIGLEAGKTEQVKTTYILPGTHSKHMNCDNSFVTDFKTFMTGELFDTITKHTILQNSVTIGEFHEPNRKAFINGVKASLNSSVLNTIFSVRANTLFDRYDPTENYYYLSGLLIGEELQQLKNYKGKISLIASGKLLQLYVTAIEVMGFENRTEVVSAIQSDNAVVLGQFQILKNILV